MDDKELWGEEITEKEREKLNELLKKANETTEKSIKELETRCHFRDFNWAFSFSTRYIT